MFHVSFFGQLNGFVAPSWLCSHPSTHHGHQLLQQESFAFIAISVAFLIMITSLQIFKGQVCFMSVFLSIQDWEVVPFFIATQPTCIVRCFFFDVFGDEPLDTVLSEHLQRLLLICAYLQEGMSKNGMLQGFQVNV